MKNRVLTLKKTFLAFLTLFAFSQISWSQDFTVTYTGPDTIYVDGNCEAIMNWGHPGSVSVVSNDPLCPLMTLTLTNIIDNNSNSYPLTPLPPLTPFNGGDVVTVFYTAENTCAQTLLFGITVEFVDTLAPVISPADVPVDVTVSCEIPAQPIVNATDNCEGVFPTIVSDVPTAINYCVGGSIIRTFTATDNAGNTSSATQNIVISPNGGPSISAAFLATITDVTVSCDMIPVAPTLTATDILDDCTAPAAVTIINNGTESSVPGAGCPNTEILTRVWTLEDGCGLQFNIVQMITVEDNSGPVITPPASVNVTLQCSGPSTPETLIQNYADDNITVTDNCGAATWTNDFVALVPGACSGTGTATVIYTASDGCNTSSITIDFTVEDNSIPTVVAASNQTVECDGTGNGVDLTAWLSTDGGSSATDICSPTNLIVKTITVPSDGTTNDPATALANSVALGCGGGTVGSITVRFTYTDDCGNADFTEANFTIEDTNGPTISPTIGASDLTVECDGFGNAGALSTWLNNAGGAVATDVCGGGPITWRTDPPAPVLSAICGNSGSVTVDFYASDACGNENPIPTTATFTIDDSTPPTWDATPNPLTLECDGTADPGGQIAAWLANNGNGGLASDACNPGVITYDHNYTGISDECGATGSVNVIFTAEDQCGNIVDWTVTLTVEDTVDPTWSIAPSNLTIECDGVIDIPTRITDWLDNVGDTGEATDNCSGVVTNFSHNYMGLSDLCGQTGTATVTFTAIDDCGRTVSLDATVTVEDNTPPSFISAGGMGAQALNLECNSNTDVAITNWLNDNGMAVAVEACGNVTWSNDYTGYSAVCPGPGTTTVIFTAEDECGNMETTSAIITVIDTGMPNINTAPVNATAQCDTFLLADYEAWRDAHGGALASDACSSIDNGVGSTNWTYMETFTAQCNNANPEVGFYTVIFTVTDDCGFAVSAPAVSYSVIDTKGPVISMDAVDALEECTSGVTNQNQLETWIDNFGGAVAFDPCSDHRWVNFDFLTTDDIPVMGTADFGDNANYPQVTANDCDWSVSVIFYVKDSCNNLSQTIASFTIEDTTPPVLSAIPGNITVDCNAPSPFLPTATDNCDAMVDIVMVADTAMNCANDYVVTRTWTATDDCGFTDVQVRVITVEDDTPPSVTAPGDISVQCDGVPAQTIAQAIISDMCDSNPMIVMTADTVPGSCDYNYVITRRWTVTDACGNSNFDEQVVTVSDNTFPTITGILPSNTTVDCDNIPNPPVAGTDIIGADNCGLASFDYLQVSTQGIDPEMCDFYNYSLTRTWTAEDICGNISIHTQVITVQDVQAPTFTRPVNLTVDCQHVNNLAVTGDATNVADNCDGSPAVTFVDNITVPGSCPFNYTLERTWTVTDACGLSMSDVQTIFVQDITPPSFTTAPQNETISCTSNADADAAYAAWIANRAGGAATDLCGTVAWFVLEPGSYDINNPATFITPPVGLTAAVCPSPTQGIYRTDDVSFVVLDDCGNASEATVTFTITDNTPPVIVDCPTNMTFDNDPGICGVNYFLYPPLITDECASTSTNVNVTVTENIASNIPGDNLSIVNPVVLNIGPLPSNPAVANDPVVLTIDVSNFDGEENTEFFNILGEDGSTLGTTVSSLTQCASSTTVISLTATQVNAWASNDGMVTITLSPNITADPVFAINDICPAGGGGSTASGKLEYTTVSPNDLVYEYSINNGSRVQVSPGTIVPYLFEVGTTQVTYFATDCAGNEAICGYSIIVNDNELPTMTCPTDIVVALPANVDCSVGASVDLNPPANIFDNCGFQNVYSQVQPTDPTQQLLTFSYNPNYLDYVADDKSFTWFGTGANAANGTVTFTVRVEGDVEDPDEYFEILGEDNSLIGTTQAGQPNVTVVAGVCPDLSVSITTISVPVATFNSWAADGQVSISAISFDDFGTPAPGVMGDGISPACTTFLSGTPDGTPDNESNITVVLDYTSVTPVYFASGATTIGTSVFPIPLAPVTHDFNVGTTTVTYQIEDVNGNVNTCTFDVTVEDDTPPNALCQPTTIFVNPDGLPYILDVSEVDGGSNDNCGIASMTVSPNSFTCADIGTTQNVTLEVTDDSGNISTCMAPVSIQAIQLSPSFTIGLCGDENLNLFANAPIGLYTYEWSGPNDFVSFLENPVIMNANATYSGTYVVEISGPGGCQAVGAITITINSAPNTPNIDVADSDVCSNESIEISTQSYAGTVVTYTWYAGVSPTGIVAATTQVPTYSIPNPTPGTYTYYVVVEVDGCESNPSGAVSVDVSESPVITGITNTAIDCATGNEDMILTPTVTPAGAYTYEWTGPNGFFSTAMEATLPDVNSTDNGSYTLTVFGAGGCSSNPFTHVISVDDLPTTPVITSFDNQLCEGDLLQLQLVNNPYIGSNISYTWETPGQGTLVTTTASLTINSATIDDSGNYTVFVIVDGCISDISGDFVVNVNSIPNAPTATYNGPVCAGTTLQLSTDFVPGASYFWTGPNNFNSTQQNPLVFPVDATYEGTYFVSLVVNGCPSAASAPLLVQVNDAPEAVIALNNGPICLGSSISVLELSISSGSAIAGATYTWYDATTNTIVAGPTTSLTSTITDLSAYSSGSNGFYVVADVTSCPSQPSIPTTVVFDEIPTNGSFAGNDIAVCDNNSVILNAQPPSVGTGEWTQTGGSIVVIANPNQATTAIAGLLAGETYSFAWTLSNGSCIDYASDTVMVVVDVDVVIADAGLDFELCNETSTTLNAVSVSGGVTGTWTQPSSQALLGVTIVDPTNPTSAITGLMPGNNYQFIWTLSNAGCGDFSSDIVVLTNSGTGGIEAFAGNDETVCGADETILTAVGAPAGSVGTWTTPTAGVNVLATSQANTFVTDLQPGENIFNWTLSNSICGEYSTDQVVIFYEPAPEGNNDSYDISFNGGAAMNVLDNDNIISGYTITYTEPAFGTLTESNGVFTYTSNLVYVGMDEFTYEICSDICPDECDVAIVSLNVGGDATCEIPTIFSPNNDGINDEFIVPCLSTDLYPDNVVSIFNQWGDEVFRQAQYLNDWRGTYKGEDLPTSTYYFVVDLGDGSAPQVGFLVLER